MKKFAATLLILIGMIGIPAAADAATGVDWTQATNAAAWGVRQEFVGLAFNDKLWVMGGTQSGIFNDVWYSSDGATWNQATNAAAWQAREDFSAVDFDDKLWIMGGADGFGGNLNDVWYSNDGVTWTEATSSAQWNVRNQFGATVLAGNIWVMGGNNVTVQNDVWYSSDGVTWTEATANASWNARHEFGVTSFDDKLWVMGGVDGSSDKLNDVWYSSDGVTWTEATSSAQWSARYNLKVAVLDNKLWVIGGNDGSDNLHDVWYSSDGVTWTEATSSAAWSKRNFFNAAVLNDKLWVIGGSGLHDVWYSALTRTVSFNTQGGSSVADITGSGASITLPSAPTRSGYAFQNWNTASDGSGTSYSAGATFTLPSGDTSLYAIWQQNAVVSNAGSAGLPYCSGPMAPGWNVGLPNGGCGGTAAVAAVPLASISLPAIAAVQPCSAYAFTRTLRSGMTGEDVLALQKFLNCAGFPIAATGIGSAGQETNYFGGLTRAAVNAFQAKYAADILIPAGVDSPTGIFAFLSQKKAYSLMVSQ